jgi:hypothetical protein
VLKRVCKNFTQLTSSRWTSVVLSASCQRSGSDAGVASSRRTSVTDIIGSFIATQTFHDAIYCRSLAAIRPAETPATTRRAPPLGDLAPVAQRPGRRSRLDNSRVPTGPVRCQATARDRTGIVAACNRTEIQIPCIPLAFA